MIATLANHVWQSTLFGVAAALVVVALRRNSAQVRYWVWMAASVKFLVPFSLLVSLGSHLGWVGTGRFAQRAALTFVMDELGQPFPAARTSVAAPVTEPSSPVSREGIVISIWMGGLVALAGWRLGQWRRVRRAVGRATVLTDGRERAVLERIRRGREIGLLACPASFEPGVWGIFRSVLLLPAGIAERLADVQLESILAHEMAHMARRDNLTALIHGFTEGLFWFHPLVWWIGARLVEERERACDEEVLRLGSAPEVYAESILKTCRFYVESPLACVAGVTGSDLKKRIEDIMTNGKAASLDWSRKLVLGCAGFAAVAGPLAIGVINAPAGRAQSTPAAFETASVRSNHGERKRVSLHSDAGGIQYQGVTLAMCVQKAYDVKPYQISGPDWLWTEEYDITAKAGSAASEDQIHAMLQSLLADRFKVALHRDKKDTSVWMMTVGKGGPKFHVAEDGPEAALVPAGNKLHFPRTTMTSFAAFLSNLRSVGRPVVDATELKGLFDLTITLSDLPADAGVGDLKRAMVLGETMLTDVQSQLGLKLEARKVPMDVLVIDRAEKVPTEN